MVASLDTMVSTAWHIKPWKTSCADSILHCLSFYCMISDDCVHTAGSDKQQEEENIYGTSLAVQWWRLLASTAGGTGLVCGQGTKSLRAGWWAKNKLGGAFMELCMGNAMLWGTQGENVRTLF